MGSSKIIFVGAVAVIIGLFGFGIKKAETTSADIAYAQAFRLQAKTLAEQGLQLCVRYMPGNVSDTDEGSYTRETTAGTYGWSITKNDLPANRLRITSYGVLNDQKATMVSILEELPDGPRPSNVRSWKDWKLISSVRTFTTVE